MKPLYTYFFTIIFISLSIFACQSEEKKTFDLLIKNVNIVYTESGEITKNQLIGINADTLSFIQSADNAKNILGKKTIDAKGGYIMPGLWDNHVHFRGGDSLASENRNLLPLFLRYGITTVRDAGGDITPQILKWRDAIESGKLAGPTIFTAGPKLDGEKPAWAGSIKVNKKEHVSPALDSLELLGVDFVKIYDGSISADMYYEIIRQTEERGLKVTGHMPLTAKLSTAIDYGVDGSEHMYYVMKACSSIEDSLTESGQRYGMMTQVVETYDESIANSFFNKLSENEVYTTPTLYIAKTLGELADTDHTNDSLLIYIGEGIQETYKGRIESAKRAKASGNTSRNEMSKQAKNMIKPMFDARAPILAGSDCGPYNSFVYPGESLHGELRMLVESGLTPQQALLTSTINGARFFNVENKYKMKVGSKSDLLILSKNPLEDISNLTAIQAVIKNGNYFNTIDLDEMLLKLKVSP